MPRKFDFLSPGIEIREVDQSILPAEVDADGPIIMLKLPVVVVVFADLPILTL